MNVHTSPSVIKALQKLWVSLPVRAPNDGAEDPTQRQRDILESYCFALSEFSDEAIWATVDKLRAGKIEEASKNFCPKAPELASYVRAEQTRILASRRERQLPKPDLPAHDEEHRAKMLGLLRTLKRALAGDKEAQKTLEPWGWKP